MKTKMKVILAVLLLIVLAAAGASAYAYQSERTPQYALEQLAEGLANRDAAKIHRYADVESVVTTSYDESTDILAVHIEDLHQTYPQDWFFRHDTAFMKDYIANRRSDDLVFIQRCIEFYADDNLTPISRSDGQAKWLSDEGVKFRDNYTVSLKGVEQKGDTAFATIEFTGKDTDYGRLVPHLTAIAELHQRSDGHWQLTRFSNVGEMFYPIVKGIEDYWTMQGWQ